MCGEQNSPLDLWSQYKGSPPRVRGTAFPCRTRTRRTRITPACAGNSHILVVLVKPEQDHPRVCGEQAAAVHLGHRLAGSPPRVRGTDGRGRGDGDGERITPACAGNSRQSTGAGSRSGDHPRVCGEQAGGGGEHAHSGGSPPRVRGTAARGFSRRGCKRITPACAGNSWFGDEVTPAALDHPRVCGEQNSPSSEWKRSIGSPPRVRGTAFLFHSKKT